MLAAVVELAVLDVVLVTLNGTFVGREPHENAQATTGVVNATDLLNHNTIGHLLSFSNTRCTHSREMDLHAQPSENDLAALKPQ